jgi:hypothetical protein
MDASRVLVSFAQQAGIAIDDAAAARAAPIVASVLAGWSILTRGADPRVEPMSIGRWPEARHERD